MYYGQLPSPEDTICKTSSANNDFLQAVFSDVKGVLARPSRDFRWPPPPPLVIKFNDDGASSSSHCVAAFGIIARDSNGLAQLWCFFGRVVASLACFIEEWVLQIACGIDVTTSLRSFFNRTMWC